jgi:hypothetical protein
VLEFSYSAGCLVRILFQPLDNPEKGSIRKISSLIDATLGLAEKTGRYSRRVLALCREIVCP